MYRSVHFQIDYNGSLNKNVISRIKIYNKDNASDFLDHELSTYDDRNGNREILSGLKANEVAVYVQNMETGRTVLEHRADAAMNPASTMKLLTAWYSLNRLSPDYRIRTYWHSKAKIENGVLQGDLVL